MTRNTISDSASNEISTLPISCDSIKPFLKPKENGGGVITGG